MKTVVVLGSSYGGKHRTTSTMTLVSQLIPYYHRAGTRAAQLLVQGLPEGWRTVVIDKNTHFNHLYSLPRFAILPHHGYKAFIPYTHILGPSATPKIDARHLFLHAQVTSLDLHSLTLSRAFPEHGIEDPARTLQFDYLVYAAGSQLPAPINLWGPVDAETEKEGNQAHDGSKANALRWLERFRAMVERAPSVLVVGGGALGIREYTYEMP